MEPIRSTKTARLRTLRMYREDLDEFVALFQQTCASVTISDNKNRYSSLDEMKAHGGSTIRFFDIRGEKPSVHFLLNQIEVLQGSTGGTRSVFNELRTEEITDEADNLFFKVRELLLTYQRPVVRWPFLILDVVIITALVLFVRHESALGVPAWGALICSLLLVASVIGTVRIPNQISLEKKTDSPSFWERNQESFAIHAITSAISVIIGYLFGRFLR